MNNNSMFALIAMFLNSICCGFSTYRDKDNLWLVIFLILIVVYIICIFIEVLQEEKEKE